MVKKVYAELDSLTFERIKKSKNSNGMIDEKKFFRGLKEGDSVIFSCNSKKIEAYLKKIKNYKNIGEYLKENIELGMLEVNSNNPIDFLSYMNHDKVRIYEVDYHPYDQYDHDDRYDNDDQYDNDDNDDHDDANKILENFISSLFENDE